MKQGYKELNIQLGARIRVAREKIGLSRDKFAEAVGISTQFAADIERGRAGPSVETICKICETLGVSADYVLRGENTDLKVTAADIEALLSSISPELHPYLIAGLRNQIELIEAMKK